MHAVGDRLLRQTLRRVLVGVAAIALAGCSAGFPDGYRGDAYVMNTPETDPCACRVLFPAIDLCQTQSWEFTLAGVPHGEFFFYLRVRGSVDEAPPAAAIRAGRISYEFADAAGRVLDSGEGDLADVGVVLEHPDSGGGMLESGWEFFRSSGETDALMVPPGDPRQHFRLDEQAVYTLRIRVECDASSGAPQHFRAVPSLAGRQRPYFVL